MLGYTPSGPDYEDDEDHSDSTPVHFNLFEKIFFGILAVTIVAVLILAAVSTAHVNTVS